MSDVSGAPAPAPDVGSAPVLALETIREAATDKIAALKRDPAFADAYLKGGSEQRNQMRTLLELAHGQRSEAERRELAQSIKLEPMRTLAAADRQREAATSAEDAIRPNYGEYGRTLGAEGLADTHRDLSAWVKSTGLPETTSRHLLQHIADEGSKLMRMTGDEKTAWSQQQNKWLLGMAHGDQAVVDGWRTAAEKVVAGSAFKLKDSLTLNSAYAISTLARAGKMKK